MNMKKPHERELTVDEIKSAIVVLNDFENKVISLKYLTHSKKISAVQVSMELEVSEYQVRKTVNEAMKKLHDYYNTQI